MINESAKNSLKLLIIEPKGGMFSLPQLTGPVFISQCAMAQAACLYRGADFFKVGDNIVVPKSSMAPCTEFTNFRQQYCRYIYFNDNS